MAAHSRYDCIESTFARRLPQNSARCRRPPSNGWRRPLRQKKSGVFKLFLGYAPGVGKTYSMLSEAIRRKSRGEDVVIGVIETHGRKATAELASRIEAVPRKQIEYKGTLFEEMDVDAILARKPQVALVDELAHTNIEGSKHHKRYEDVFELLDNKIDVVSTMNVQHLESVTPMVHKITGVLVRETVPDWVLKRVDEIVMSDVTPEALQTRMRRGDIYPMERVDRALGNFFRPSNLIALREIALRHVAQVVDRSLEPYLDKESSPGAISTWLNALRWASAPIRRRSIWWRARRAWRRPSMASSTSCTSIPAPTTTIPSGSARYRRTCTLPTISAPPSCG